MKKAVAVGLVIMLAGVSTKLGAAEPKESAIEAAKGYTTLMSSDEPIKAVETYWDLPQMFQLMFGEHLKKHSVAEQEEMKKLFLSFLRKVYANPQIAEAMKKATFSDFASKEPRDGKTVVTFNA